MSKPKRKRTYSSSESGCVKCDCRRKSIHLAQKSKMRKSIKVTWTWIEKNFNPFFFFYHRHHFFSSKLCNALLSIQMLLWVKKEKRLEIQFDNWVISLCLSVKDENDNDGDYKHHQWNDFHVLCLALVHWEKNVVSNLINEFNAFDDGSKCSLTLN
jgi:hypothetical protein